LCEEFPAERKPSQEIKCLHQLAGGYIDPEILELQSAIII
jgi:hypothetical protein